MLALAHRRSLERGHMLLHFILFTGIMGWQGGRCRERLSCNYRVAKFDPHNKQNGAFIYTQLKFILWFLFGEIRGAKSLKLVKSIMLKNICNNSIYYFKHAWDFFRYNLLIFSHQQLLQFPVIGMFIERKILYNLNSVAVQLRGLFLWVSKRSCWQWEWKYHSE